MLAIRDDKGRVWECKGATNEEVADTVILWRSWGIRCETCLVKLH